MSGNPVENSGYLLKLSFLSFLYVSIITLFVLPTNIFPQSTHSSIPGEQQAQVKAWWYSQEPKIYISSSSYSNYQYASGGLIPIASTDEPVVSISAYNISGEAEFELYEAQLEDVFDYLMYEDENQQVQKEIDTDNFTFVTSFKNNIKDDVSLPMEDRGVYFLKVNIQGIEANAYILRSNVGSVVKEAGDEFVFWSQDLRSKRSLSSGNIQVYNLQDEVTELSNVSINNEGIATTALTSQADIAVTTQGEEVAILPINLRYLNTGWDNDRFQDFELDKRYFSFTDRPLYRPGDTIYYKSIVRNEDDVRYSIPGGTVNVVLTNYGRENPVYEEDVPLSSTGTVAGEIEIPEDLTTGTYQLRFDGSNWTNNVTVEVQEFRKPAYFVEVLTDKREYVSGEDLELTIRGEYFSGQPLVASNVEYKVYASDYYDYRYYDHIGRQISDDYRYGWYRRNVLTSGTVDLDEQGLAQITLDTQSDENQGKPQVYSVEVHYQGATSDQAFDRKNLLVYPGDFGIYRKNYSWSVRAGDEYNLDYKLHPYAENVDLSDRTLDIHIEREYYERIEGRYNRKSEEFIQTQQPTDAEGEISLNFTPQEEGRYVITIEARDDQDNEIIKKFSVYATDRNFARYGNTGNNELTITPDRELYEPGDLANVVIYSSIPDRDVFLSFDRDRLNRYQVVSMEGNTAELQLPLIETDMPNIYLSAASFGNDELHWSSKNIEVSAEKMRLQVDISTDNEKYGPGDTAVVDVETKDINGNPIAADVAVWAVDSAIYELEDDSLGNAFDKFWTNRRDDTQSGHSLEGITVRQAEGGGCFAAGTQILMADGTLKNIEDVEVGDIIKTREDPLSKQLVDAKVTETSEKEVSGYMLINGKLKITDNHVLLVNGQWKEASDIRGGDILATTEGVEEVNSIEWQLGKTTVYNLEIEDQHTFFADGIFVHNQKGGAAREVLEDTAYWNPSVWTGANGRAQLTISLPDNLTTWSIAAVAASSDTRVGQQRGEITVTKDLIIRPIIPNVLREGDDIILSALAQNFTEEDKTFNVLLEFEEGQVDESEKTDVFIKSRGTEQVFWNVRPEQITEEAELRFVLYEADNESSGDNLIRTLPVQRFGFKETAGYSANGGKEYKVNLHADSINEDTEIKLNLSPTVLGSLPASMEYLIDYPYGCVEQTTSRFVPSVIVKQNESLFPDLLEDKDIDEIIERGLSRLSSLQRSDGGWGWWYGEGNSYISAYVVEYLLEAEGLGYDMDQHMLSSARNYFSSLNPDNNYDYVAKYYALTLFNSEQTTYTPNVEDLNDFLLSMLVIANKKNGINDNNANGYNELVRRAKQQGDTVYWDNTGESRYFASVDSATAMAIRAILEAGGDRDLAVKASQYLAKSRNKHYWSNTHATAHTIKAIIELSKSGNELNPNYSYEVLIDDQRLTSGTVTSADQIIRQIEIPAEDLSVDGSTIKLTQNGSGQMYSTLVVEEFRTDRDFEPSGKALKVTREIINARDRYLSLGVGEVARVRLTVEGLPNTFEYVVIEDTLPSGMVPVIESFDNEQFERSRSSSWGREYKADGVVFSRYTWRGNTTRTFEYRARVINSGDLSVPPAYAELMYSPEVNGLSKIDQVSIDHEPKELPRPPESSVGIVKSQNARSAAALLMIMVVAMTLIEERTHFFSRKWKKYRKRRLNKKRKSAIEDKTIPSHNEADEKEDESVS